MYKKNHKKEGAIIFTAWVLVPAEGCFLSRAVMDLELDLPLQSDVVQD